MIEKIGYDLVLAVVSAILGALFGVLIPKLLKDEKKTSHGNHDGDGSDNDDSADGQLRRKFRS